MADHRIERRQMLKVLCASTGAVCSGLAACGPAEPFMNEPTFVPLPAVFEGRINLKLSEFPQLMTAGMAVLGEAVGMSEPLAVVRKDDGSFTAMPAVCTHMKCNLKFNQLNATLDCPCHGSTFELDGAVINGPAVKSLRQYRVEFDGQIVGVVLDS
jgi:Rieske Fe-S protein